MTTSANQRAAHLPQTSRADAERHSSAEYGALLAQVHALEPHHWAAQTDCTEWTFKLRQVASGFCQGQKGVYRIKVIAK